MYNYEKMRLRVWGIRCLGKVVGYSAQWVPPTELMLRYPLRSSKVFGGVGRSRDGAIREANYWMDQRSPPGPA